MADRVRNPEAVLAALRELMDAYPHLRVGQAIVNAVGEDPFYLEDDDMLMRLRSSLAAWRGTK